MRWTQSETGGLDPETFAEPRSSITRPSTVARSPRSSIALLRTRSSRRLPGPDRHPRRAREPVPPGLPRPARITCRRARASRSSYPNVRGSSGYGKSYLKLDNGFLREDPVKDIGALLDWIAKQPDLDASRVAVAGGSYGGYMSLATMTHYSDRLKAGIDLVGISNFASFLKNTQGYRRDLRRAEYGDERDPKMREFLDKISPLTSAAKIKVPILVVAGQNDPRVPVTRVRAGRRRGSQERGAASGTSVGKNEGHGFAKKKNVDYLQFVQALFLKKYLLN